MHSEASSVRIGSRLTTLFLSTMLEEQAEELDVVERDSKLQIPALACGEAEHSPLSGEATTVLLTRPSGPVDSISG